MENNTSKVGFVVDSGCDLYALEAKKYGVEIVPLKIDIEDKPYISSVNENTSFEEEDKIREDFYHKIIGNSVKTAAPNLHDFEKTYAKLSEKGIDNIFSVHLASSASLTYGAARTSATGYMAKNPKVNISVIDSNSIGPMIRYALLETFDKYEKGQVDDNNFEKAFIDLSQRVNVYFTVDNLNHLRDGGRMSKAQCAIGNILGIKPIISFDKDFSRENQISSSSSSPVYLDSKVRGNKKLHKNLVEKVLENHNSIREDGTFSGAICYTSNETLPLAKELLDKLSKEIEIPKDIKMLKIGELVGGHVGNTGYGIIYTK
jgi:DegV family protein with EDD domain